MDDTGSWWYDRNIAFGKSTDPSNNTDMISPAFWLFSDNEFKITRSDDARHNSLLQTTGNSNSKNNNDDDDDNYNN